MRLLLAALLGCGACGGGDREEPAPAPASPGPQAAPEPAPEPDPPPAPEPVVEGDPWDAMPEGFEPVVLPDVGDDCAGPIVWVGTDAVRRSPALDPEGSPPAELAPGVARDVSQAMRPAGGILGALRMMTSSYNGPGGEPLFRWHLERTASRPVLVVDRRVDRDRVLGALRGARDGVPLRIGGVGEDGARRCAIVLAEEPPALDAQAANARYEGRLEPDGTLRVGGPGSERAPDRLDAPNRPLPGEPDEGLHVVHLDPPPGAGAATILPALARARWSERRYGWLDLPLEVPYCGPLVTECGCLAGCARGVALLGPPTDPPDQLAGPLEGRAVSVRLAEGQTPRPGRIERWCYDETTRRVAPAPPIEGPDCFEVFALDGDCAGRACAPRAKPDCGACQACDATCDAEVGR